MAYHHKKNRENQTSYASNVSKQCHLWNILDPPKNHWTQHDQTSKSSYKFIWHTGDRQRNSLKYSIQMESVKSRLWEIPYEKMMLFIKKHGGDGVGTFGSNGMFDDIRNFC